MNISIWFSCLDDLIPEEMVRTFAAKGCAFFKLDYIRNLTDLLFYEADHP